MAPGGYLGVPVDDDPTETDAGRRATDPHQPRADPPPTARSPYLTLAAWMAAPRSGGGRGG